VGSGLTIGPLPISKGVVVTLPSCRSASSSIAMLHLSHPMGEKQSAVMMRQRNETDLLWSLAMNSTYHHAANMAYGPNMGNNFPHAGYVLGRNAGLFGNFAAIARAVGDIARGAEGIALGLEAAAHGFAGLANGATGVGHILRNVYQRWYGVLPEERRQSLFTRCLIHVTCVYFS